MNKELGKQSTIFIYDSVTSRKIEKTKIGERRSAQTREYGANNRWRLLSTMEASRHIADRYG